MDPKRIDNGFGAALRNARTKEGMSQEELAGALFLNGSNISSATIGKIERGERKVTIGEACVIAATLKLPLDDLTTIPSSLTKEALSARLYRLRADLIDAVRDFEYGQQLTALLSGTLEVVDQQELEYEVLESAEEVLELYRMEQSSDNEYLQRGIPWTVSTPLLEKFREKFGRSVELKARTRAVEVIKSSPITSDLNG